MAPMAPGVSAEEMHLRVPFSGRQMSAIADAPGPHILLEAGGLLLNPAELLRRLALNDADAFPLLFPLGGDG